VRIGNKTRLSSQRILRLDKTVTKFSVTDGLVLSPVQFTPRTPTRQDKTILSCPCSRCELAIKILRTTETVVLTDNSTNVTGAGTGNGTINYNTIDV